MGTIQAYLGAFFYHMTGSSAFSLTWARCCCLPSPFAASIFWCVRSFPLAMRSSWPPCWPLQRSHDGGAHAGQWRIRRDDGLRRVDLWLPAWLALNAPEASRSLSAGVCWPMRHWDSSQAWLWSDQLISGGSALLLVVLLTWCRRELWGRAGVLWLLGLFLGAARWCPIT